MMLMMLTYGRAPLSEHHQHNWGVRFATLKAVSITPVLSFPQHTKGFLKDSRGPLTPQKSIISLKACPRGLGQEEFGLKDRPRGTGGPTDGEYADDLI